MLFIEDSKSKETRTICVGSKDRAGAVISVFKNDDLLAQNAYNDGHDQSRGKRLLKYTCMCRV